MTLEQAKTAKLGKGFALEPVRPGQLEATGPLPEKRERKKADIFGMLRAYNRVVWSQVPTFCASLPCLAAWLKHGMYGPVGRL